MKKKTLLPAITLVLLLSTTFFATVYRTYGGKQTVKELNLAQDDEIGKSDFEGVLHGEFIWESLTKHLLFIKY